MASSSSAKCDRCNGLILQGCCINCGRTPPSKVTSLLHEKNERGAQREQEFLETRKRLVEAFKGLAAVEAKILDHYRKDLTDRHATFLENPTKANERLHKKASSAYRRQHLKVTHPIKAKVLARYDRNPGRPEGSTKKRDPELARYIAFIVKSGLATKADVLRYLQRFSTKNGRFAKNDRLRLESHIRQGQQDLRKLRITIHWIGSLPRPTALTRLRSSLLRHIQRLAPRFLHRTTASR